MKKGDTFSQYRMYTRLAYLGSPFLLEATQGTPRVTGLRIVRNVGKGPVTVRPGPAQGYVSEETIHPWRFPPPAAARTYRFRGVVKLTRDLVVREQDRFEAEAGTRFLLGPGVSIVLRSRVDLSGIEVNRLDASRPWGVFVLQGAAASDSSVVSSSFRGGGDATLNHVYYSGMVSIHYADRVRFKDCVFADNLQGDDTVRFACCRELRVEACRVDGANGDAIDCDISDGIILDTHIHRPRNDGIDLMTADVELVRNTVEGAGDKGISFGESANPRVTDCRLRGCVMGVGLKDASNPILTRVEITGCDLAVSGYDKNWRYPGGGRGVLVECTLKDNVRDVALDPASRLRMVRCEVGEPFRVPAEILQDGRLELIDLVRRKDAR
jgi:hypothetical protein